MIRIGGRIVKTGIAAGLSVFIARILNLEPAIFACLISTLSVQRSFYNSIMQSMQIVGSVLMGSVIGAVFAFSFGLHPVAVIFATMIMILVCLKLKWQDQIVLSIVTVLTFMEFGSQNFIQFTSHRILLGLIGACCGIILNIPFMPYHKKNVEENLKNIDSKTRDILTCFSNHLNPADKFSLNDSDIRYELDMLKHQIEDGISFTKLLREEQRYRFMPDNPTEKYLQNFYTFSMLVEILEDMNDAVENINTPVPQLIPVIRFNNLLAKMQKVYFSGYNVPLRKTEDILNNLENKSWWKTLPECEEDFFTRTALLHFFNELKKYYRNMTRLNPFPGDTQDKKTFFLFKNINLKQRFPGNNKP